MLPAAADGEQTLSCECRHFGQPRAEMTRRFLRACENPLVNIIGHPSARRIGRRPPVEVD